MTATSNYIRMGFYDDFKGHDTILISVDKVGLQEIERAFHVLSQGLHSFNFSELLLLDKEFCVEIIAYNDIENSGLKQIGEDKFEWRLTSVLWSQFREMSTVLHNNAGGAHQYLDAESNYFNSEVNFIDPESLQVVLSLEEYSLNFWKEHFNRNNRVSAK